MDSPDAPAISHMEMIRGGPSEKRHLGQWLATAICGNDITSSCLYVAAIATVYAGVLAPIVLLLVGGVLYVFPVSKRQNGRVQHSVNREYG